jgi:hypothetical protein
MRSGESASSAKRLAAHQIADDEQRPAIAEHSAGKIAKNDLDFVLCGLRGLCVLRTV